MRFVSKLAAFAVHIAMAKADECVMHATQVTTPVPSAVPEEPVSYENELDFDATTGVTLRIDGQDVATVYTRRIEDNLFNLSDGDPSPLAQNTIIEYRSREYTQVIYSNSFTLGASQTLSFYSCALSDSHQKYHCLVAVKEGSNSLQVDTYRLQSDYFSQAGDDPLADGESYDKFQVVYGGDSTNLEFAIYDNGSTEIEEYLGSNDGFFDSFPYSDLPLEYEPFCNKPFSDIDRVLGIVFDKGDGSEKIKVSGPPHPSYYESIRQLCSWTTETETYYTSTCTDSIPDNSYYLKVQLAMTLFNITILWYCFVYGYLFPKDLKTIDEEEPQCDETPTAPGCDDIIDPPVIIIDF